MCYETKKTAKMAKLKTTMKEKLLFFHSKRLWKLFYLLLATHL